MPGTELDYISNKVEHDNELLLSVWLRNVTTDELKAGMLQFLEVLRTENIRCWIVDSRRVHNLQYSEQEWLAREFVPLLLETGIQKIARINTSDIFHYISFEQIAEKCLERFKVDVSFAQFTTVEAAYEWIMFN